MVTDEAAALGTRRAQALPDGENLKGSHGIAVGGISKWAASFKKDAETFGLDNHFITKADHPTADNARYHIDLDAAVDAVAALQTTSTDQLPAKLQTHWDSLKKDGTDAKGFKRGVVTNFARYATLYATGLEMAAGQFCDESKSLKAAYQKAAKDWAHDGLAARHKKVKAFLRKRGIKVGSVDIGPGNSNPQVGFELRQRGFFSSRVRSFVYSTKSWSKKQADEHKKAPIAAINGTVAHFREHGTLSLDKSSKKSLRTLYKQMRDKQALEQLDPVEHKVSRRPKSAEHLAKLAKSEHKRFRWSRKMPYTTFLKSRGIDVKGKSQKELVSDIRTRVGRVR